MVAVGALHPGREHRGEGMACLGLPEREAWAVCAPESGDRTYCQRLQGAFRSCRQPRCSFSYNPQILTEELLCLTLS